MSDPVALGGDLPTVSVWEEDTAEQVWRWCGELPGCETLTFIPTNLDDGSWTLTMDVDAEGADLLVEGRRSLIGWRGYESTWGIVPHLSRDETTKQPSLEVTGPGAFAVFGWELAWPDPTADVNAQPVLGPDDPPTYSGPAETVIKKIVAANLRDRRGMNIVIPPDLGRGGEVTARAEFQKLSDLIPQLAKDGGVTVDVGLVRRGGTGSTRADLTLLVDVPPDLTREVHLTADAKTIDDFDYAKTEPTLTMAVVAGAGTGGVDRVRRIVTTPESEAAALEWGGHRVGFVDGPDSFDPAELDQAGRQAIADGAATYALTMTAADTDGQMAFRDYAPGASVTAGPLKGVPTFPDVVASVEVNLTVAEGVTVRPTLGDPAATDEDLDVAATIALLQQGLRQQQTRK